MFEAVAYWSAKLNLADLEEDEAVKKTIQQLKDEQYKSAQAMPLRGLPYLCKARVNDKIRVVYARIWWQGKRTLLIVCIHSKHNYPELIRELASVVTYLENNSIPEDAMAFLEDKPLEKPTAESCFTPLKFHSKQFVLFNDEQNRAINAPPGSAIIVRGPAGSGKTFVALEFVNQSQQNSVSDPLARVLYIAAAPSFVGTRRKDYNDSPSAQMPGADKTTFLTYDNLLLLLDPTLTAERKASFKLFSDWIKRYFNKNRGLDVFSRDLSYFGKQLNVNLFFHFFCNLCGYIDRFEDQIGKHETSLSSNQIDWLIIAYKKFKAYLAIKNVFFSEFQEVSFAALAGFNYSIAADEAQDFSTLQLRILKELANEQVCFVFDTRQNIWNVFSIDPFLERLYGKDKLFRTTLPHSYRCRHNILRVAKEIDRIKGCLTGGLIDNKDEAMKVMTLGIDEDPGLVKLLDQSPMSIDFINEHYSNTPNTVIITEEHYVKEAKEIFNGHRLVFTPAQYKGSETDFVIYYRFLESNYIQDICHEIEKMGGLVSETHSNRPNSYQIANKHFRTTFGSWYTSITRARERLILVQGEHTSFNLAPLLNLIKRVINSQCNQKIESRPFESQIKSQWQEQFNQLFENGLDEEALIIWLEYLEGTPESFAEKQKIRDSFITLNGAGLLASTPQVSVQTESVEAPGQKAKNPKPNRKRKNKNKNKKIKRKIIIHEPESQPTEPDTLLLFESIQKIVDKAKAYSYMTQNPPASLANYFNIVASSLRSTQDLVVQLMKNNGTFTSETIRYYLTHAHMLNGCSPDYLLSIAIIVEAAFSGLTANIKEFLMINPDRTESFHVGVESQGFFYDICSQRIYPITKFANCESRELIQTQTLLEFGKMKESVQAFYNSNLDNCLPSECRKARTYLTFNNQDKNSCAIKVGILFPYLCEKFNETLTQPIYIENPIIAEQVQTNIFRDFMWMLNELRTGKISKKSKYQENSIRERLNRLIPNISFKELILILSYKHSNPERYGMELIKFIENLGDNLNNNHNKWVANTVHRFLIEDTFVVLERKSYAYGFILNGEGSKSYNHFINALTRITIDEVLLNTQEASRKALEPYYHHVAFINTGVLFDERMKAQWMLLEEAQVLITKDVSISQFKIRNSDEIRTAIIVDNRIYDLTNRKLYPRNEYEKLIDASTEELPNQIKLRPIDTPSFIENMIKNCELKYLATQKNIIAREGRNLIKDIDLLACFKYLGEQLKESFKDEVLNYFPDITKRIRQQIFRELVRLYTLLPQDHEQKSNLALTLGGELGLLVICNSYLVFNANNPDDLQSKTLLAFPYSAHKSLQELHYKYLKYSSQSPYDNWFHLMTKETLAKYSAFILAKDEASNPAKPLSTNPHSLYGQRERPDVVEEKHDNKNIIRKS